MKTGISNSAKRALSLVLAFAMLIGTLFTANIGINIKADAETDEIDYSTWNIQYWNGRTDKDFAKGDGSEANPYIITNAAELNWVCTCNNNISATTKYYKIDPTIKAFVLQKEDVAKPYLSKIIGSNSSEDTRAFFEDNGLSSNLLNWYVNGSNPFNDNFDGSGVPIYGIYCDAAIKSAENCGLFPALDGGASDYREAYYEKTVTEITDIAGTESNSVVKYTQTVTQYTADGQIRKDTNGNEIAAVVTNHEGTYEKSIDKTVGGKYANDSSLVKKYTINETGITIKNIVLRNSYFKGYRRVGALTGTTWYQGEGTALALGIANVDACEISNCFLVGQNLRSTGTIVNSHGNVEMGIVGGSLGNDVVKANRLLIFGNDSEYRSYTNANNYTIDYSLKFNRTFANNGTNPNSTFYGTLTNSIVVDTTVSGLTNNFNELYVSKNYTFYDIDTVRGATAKAWAPDLAWGTDWFEAEGEYPTPIRPENYVELPIPPHVYARGTGTETTPFIIRTVDQLSKMIEEGGGYAGDEITTTEGSGASVTPFTYTQMLPYYYEVDPNIETLYINNVKDKDDVVSLASSNSAVNWKHNETTFWGHFDGNGVDIYGMISTGSYAGFVPVLGTGATIKNVDFKAAYISSDSQAAVVTTKLTDFNTYNGNDKFNSYILNVSVSESYIKTTKNESDNINKNTHGATAGGIISTDNTPDHVVISNCLYDGGSSELIDGLAAAGASDISPKAGIVGMGYQGNEFTIENCVAIDEYLVPMVSSIASATIPYPLTGHCGYRRYMSTDKASNINIKNCYAVFNEAFRGVNAQGHEHDILYGIQSIIEADSYSQQDLLMLNWIGGWKLEKVGDRTIPMPAVSISDSSISYSQRISQVGGNAGAVQIGGSGGYEKGTYGMYHTLTGAGTATDPYLITNDLELAQAIACGGKNGEQALYYKLTCDIDLEGNCWIDQVTIEGRYVYVPFEGVLDGANYMISRFSAVDETSAGLIPVLNGGTVKNIHIRNSYAGSPEKSGLIAGQVNSGTIENCSVEGSVAVNTKNTIVGNCDNAPNCVTNSYAVVDKYQIFSEDASRTLYPEAEAQWYMGPDDVVRHLDFAKAHTVTDVDGDGIILDAYELSDLVALRNLLLKKEDYLNVYADVNRDGATNILDLVTIRREMVYDYEDIADGFWRNAELGNISIYYGDNDNYDAARKLELALESMLPGTNIRKVVVNDNVVWGSQNNAAATYVHQKDYAWVKGVLYTPNGDSYTEISDSAEKAKYALDGSLQIVVGNIANTAYATNDVATAENSYAVTYDDETAAVWIQGENFTAVEQATLDFIAGSNPITGAVYSSNGVGTLDPEKQPKTVNGVTYYYSWGDEFNGTQLDLDVWSYGEMHNETSKNEKGESQYFNNLEVAFPEDMDQLYTLNGEKLTIWRGYYGDSQNSGANWGYKYLGKLADKGVTSDMSGATTKESVEGEDYIDNKFGGRVESTDIYATAGKIDTRDSVLAKQGYLEMKASYPTDGYVFACWWLMGFNGAQNNNTISNSLFGKALKLNNAAAYGANTAAAAQNAWDGTNDMDSRYPNTFKYQLPNTAFEIDIAELMQAGTENLYSNFTFHKFARAGVYDVSEKTGTDSEGNDNYKTSKKIRFIDWDLALTGNANPWLNYEYLSEKYLRQEKTSGSYVLSTTQEDPRNTTINEFLYDAPQVSTSDESAKWTKRKSDGTATNSIFKSEYQDKTYYYTYNGGLLRNENDAGPYFSGTPGKWTADTVALLKGEYIFGVEWTCDKVENKPTYTYRFTVKSTDGNTTYSDVTVNTDIIYDENNDSPHLKALSQMAGLSDAETANQYMYMLIDNTYYTSDNNGNAFDSSKLLNNDGDDKATMEIDYIRIYQNKRDIITPETEDFNNGNHFGY